MLHMDAKAMHAGRPFGITIAAIFIFLICLGSIAVGLLGAGVFKISGLDTTSVANAQAIGIAAVVVGAVQLVVAWSLWTLKGFAWFLAVLLQGINVAVGVVTIVQHGVSGTGSAAIGSLLGSALILLYFMSPGVRRAFHR